MSPTFPIKAIEVRRLRSKRGFTLIEILVATAIIAVIMVIGVGVFGQVSTLTSRSVEKAKAFQSARLGFDLVTRNVGQATLNTYLDYVDTTGKFPTDAGYNYNRPSRYARRADLQFVCDLAGKDGTFPGRAHTGTALFFQAHLGFTGSNTSFNGLDQLLSVCGYFIEFGDDPTRPGHAPAIPKYRYRLKQMLVPSQTISIFQNATGGYQWFQDFQAQSFPIADNVILLTFRPQYPDANDPTLVDTVYAYDSRAQERDNPQPPTANQLPPTLQVTMVAISESSARRMEQGAIPPAAIEQALSGKFAKIENYDADLNSLKQALIDKQIGFQVFSSAVPLRESKWSK